MDKRHTDLAVVEQLNTEVLTLPVTRCLGSPTAEIRNWSARSLGIGVGNPVSLGVFRVTGTAVDRGMTRPWSMILKVAQSPANIGLTDLGEGPDESHWNYWRRELLLFASGLLDDLPSGFAAPRYYGGSERSGNTSWLWLEDLTEARTEWSPERLELAALHLGHFNGGYLAGKEVPAFPWLSRNAARQLIATARRLLPSMEERVPGLRGHPVTQFVRAADPVLDALERLPQTFCHLDAGCYNLMSRPLPGSGEEILAIDWALAGIAPVGADLSQLAVDSRLTSGLGLFDNEPALVERYRAGLRDAGWDVDLDLVRFGYLSFMVCRLLGFFLWLLSAELKRGAPVALEDTRLSALLPVIAHVEKLMPVVP